MIKQKNLSNKIHELNINGRWCSISNKVQMVLKHFRARFSEPLNSRPKLNREGFRQLSNEEAELFVEQFSSMEIIRSVWEHGDNKGPSPE